MPTPVGGISKIFLDAPHSELHRKDSEGMLTQGECPPIRHLRVKPSFLPFPFSATIFGILILNNASAPSLTATNFYYLLIDEW
jgi:hypothetical protein